MDYLLEVDDYRYPGGWAAEGDQRSRELTRRLEEGCILRLPGIPFSLPEEDQGFLLGQKQTRSRLHKNISYRPGEDAVRGTFSDDPDDAVRIQDVMRRYSRAVCGFVNDFLRPYAGAWKLDYASFRPEEEQGRDLSVHKRNDLLHVDAFPSRPTHGGRILRVFTNINPTEDRVWITTDRFPELAAAQAGPAGLPRFARASAGRAFARGLAGLGRAVGLKAPDRSPYDEFMLHFHDWLKENESFQTGCNRIQTAFAPNTTWLVYTDGVPHAVLSGRYALEQTFIIPVEALTAPEHSPVRVLEKLAGTPMTATT